MPLIFHIWASCYSWCLLPRTPLSELAYLLQPQWLFLLWGEGSTGLGTRCCHIPGESLPALHLDLGAGTSRGWSRWWCWCALSGSVSYLRMEIQGECPIHHPFSSLNATPPHPQQTLPVGSIILRTNATSFASWDHSADAKLTKTWVMLKPRKMYLLLNRAKQHRGVQVLVVCYWGCKWSFGEFHFSIQSGPESSLYTHYQDMVQRNEVSCW